MSESLAGRSRSGGKAIIYDSDFGAIVDFRFREFAATQQLCAHSLEISRHHGDHRGITGRWTAIQAEGSAHKCRGVERKEFGGTGGADSREFPNAPEYLFEIRELPLIQLMRGPVQRDIGGNDSLDLITAVDSHEMDEGTAQAHGAAEKNHCHHDLHAYESLPKQA
jgi:hypothetical protein